ncbi:MAG: SGNH/GDSL hydrolase family protein [Kiritimatiellae bacterium]|nr:SGNH/GDSL hydrolase family protein [Kiritimatiellia bacterium]
MKLNKRVIQLWVVAVTVVTVLCTALSASAESDAARMGATAMNPGSRLGGVERTNVGVFKVLIYGNSIALHGPKADIGWTNNWGMAASAPEKDFAHLVVAGLEAKRGEKADFRIRNLAFLERNFTTEIATVAEIAEDAKWAPDYVVIAIGENVAGIDTSNAPAYRRFLADLARPFASSPKRPKIVMRSPFWMNAAKAKCTAEAAADVGAVYVDAGQLGFKNENKAIGLFSHGGVANHPGDLGMRRLADLILSGFESGKGSRQ